LLVDWLIDSLTEGVGVHCVFIVVCPSASTRSTSTAITAAALRSSGRSTGIRGNSRCQPVCTRLRLLGPLSTPTRTVSSHTVVTVDTSIEDLSMEQTYSAKYSANTIYCSVRCSCHMTKIYLVSKSLDLIINRKYVVFYVNVL